MISYTVYDPDGRFWAAYTESSGERSNVPDGYSYVDGIQDQYTRLVTCLLYTSPSPRDRQKSRMPSSA